MSLLDVSSSPVSGGSVVVRLRGDLDLATAEVLNDGLAAVESSGPPTLYLDLSLLGFMDSTGLRLILQAQHRAREREGRLVLIAARESIQRIFRVTGLQDRLEFVNSVPGQDTYN